MMPSEPEGKQEEEKAIGIGRSLLGLWELLRESRYRYLMAVVAVGISAVARTAFYYLLGYFADNILGRPEQANLLGVVALGFVGLALLQGLFTFISGRWAAAAAEGVAQRLRDTLYDHIQRLSFSYHDQTPTGDLIQRVTSDVDSLRRFYAEQALDMGRIGLLFLVNFVALLLLDVRLAGISVVVIPIIIITGVFFFVRIEKRFEAFQEQEAQLSTTLQENLTGVRVVRAFARQAFEIERFQQDNIERYRRGASLLRLHSIYWPLTDVMVGLQMIIGYFAAALMVIAGTLTLGDFLAYIGILGWLIWPMRNLGRLVVKLSQGLVSYRRVTKILDEEQESLLEGRVQPEGSLRGDVVFENVSFAYDDGTAVLRDVSFHCRPGQVVALIGGTGTGKSTLVNLLPRFYDYTGGTILLDGIELRHYPRHYLRREIGIVQQEPFLFSRTIRDNIIYGVERTVTEEQIEAATRAAAVHDVILSFPAGYDTLVGERGVTLSGGQKQRITLARTLLKSPSLLILDDATSAVDSETEAAIRETLAELMRERTSFVIAQRIQSVVDADLILVLDDGRLVQCGSHNELVQQPGTYRRIFELQNQVEADLAAELVAAGSGVG